MSMDEVTEMMKKVDKDGDSKIDFEEFKAMMNSMGDEEAE
jgi:Ca2+-binding EF-hand superfamily protein